MSVAHREATKHTTYLMMRRVFVALPAACCVFASASQLCRAAPRPGAPRALTLSFGGDGRSLGAIPFVSDAVPVGAGNSYVLLFSSASRGTSNIYRATAVRRTPGKPPMWSAQPVTFLGAPNFVNAPAPFPDGNTALCVVGTLNDAQNRDFAREGNTTSLRGTIARLDLTSGALETVVADAHCADPAPSPDGRRLAWSAERSGTESVWVSLVGGERFRVASKARHPVWLDAKTLVYESVENGRRGVYRVTLKPDGSILGDTRRQLWPHGGEVAVSPDGDTLCLATSDNSDGDLTRNAVSNTRLYVLSSDGSGARTLSGTEGACHPHWLPDGSGVVYDAPLADEKGLPPKSAQAPRVLWLLPMRSTPPVSTLLEARPSRLDTRLVEIYGSAWCEGDNAPQVKLEVGRGYTPETWQTLPTSRPPIQQGVVGRWMPPADANGTWTLRLTVTAASGETSQNVLPVELPLVAAPLQPSPITDLPPAGSGIPQIGGNPTAGGPLLPQIPTPNRQPGRGGPVAPMPLENLPPRMPSPRVPAPGTDTPPANVPPKTAPSIPSTVPPVAGGATPDDGLIPVMPPAGGLLPAPDPANNADKTYPPLILKPLPPRKNPSRPKESRKKRPMQRDNESSTPLSSVKVSDFGDAARIDVAGTPAEMEVGETLEVVATLRNRGRSIWPVSGNNPVRLLVRWTDMMGGYRVRWAVVWPQTLTKPGQTAQVRFAVTAPSRPGRYKVTYALLRVPGGTVQPPRENGDAAWPGEFGGAAYEVVVS